MNSEDNRSTRNAAEQLEDTVDIIEALENDVSTFIVSTQFAANNRNVNMICVVPIRFRFD